MPLATRTLLTLIALCAVFTAPAAALARPLLRPAGPHFDVVAGVVAAPAAALDGSGRATVTWQEAARTHRLWAQPYDAATRPRGRRWLVRQSAAAFSGVRVTAARRGRVLVTWSEGTPGATSSHYKLFEPDGTLLDEGALGAGLPAGPVLAAADGEGRFVLAWSEGDGVYAQGLEAKGGVRVARFRVAAGAPGVLAARSVVADASGRFVVFWRDDTLTPAGFHARRFDAAGTALGEPFALVGVDAAAEARGRLVVAWVDNGGAQPRVLVQRLLPTGAAAGTALQVNTGTWADQPRVVSDGAGNFVVAFRGASGAGSDVFARRYTAAGVPDGKPFPLASTTDASNTSLDLAGSPGGDVLATWLHASRSAPTLQARAFRVPPKGDFDGDLRADLVLRRERDGVTRVWTMSEGRRESNLRVWPHTPGPGWTLVSADDFSGDRRQDLVFRNDDTGAVYFAALGGEWGTEVSGGAWLHPAGPAGATLVATGDFNQDGWPDLVWHNAVTRQVTVWTMEGTQHVGTLTPTPDAAPDASWTVVGAQDWNGDGTRDMLWYDGGTGQLVQWLLDADLVRTAARPTEPPAASDPEWSVVATGDYGVGAGGISGTNDIVWHSAKTQRQVIWFLDTDGRRTSGVFTTPARPSGEVTLAGPR